MERGSVTPSMEDVVTSLREQFCTLESRSGEMFHTRLSCVDGAGNADGGVLVAGLYVWGVTLKWKVLRLQIISMYSEYTCLFARNIHLLSCRTGDDVDVDVQRAGRIQFSVERWISLRAGGG